jgi:hypothetical protein
MNIKIIAGAAVAIGAAVVGLFAKKGVDTLDSKENQEATPEKVSTDNVTIELVDPIADDTDEKTAPEENTKED